MSDAPAFLFVYGTLMSHLDCDLGREQRAALHRRARSFGAASMQGRLYSLGEYPGLITSHDPGDRIAGEVLRLDCPTETFAMLDAYEGVAKAADPASRGEYERIIAPARLAGGTLLSVWVYVYRGPTCGKAPVASGSWAPIAPSHFD